MYSKVGLHHSVKSTVFSYCQVFYKMCIIILLSFLLMTITGNFFHVTHNHIIVFSKFIKKEKEKRPGDGGTHH